MRPCTSCRSEDTQPLELGLVGRLVSSIGGEATLRTWVCRVCRHVDLWVDEPALAPERAAAEDEDAAEPLPTPTPALG